MMVLDLDGFADTNWRNPEQMCHYSIFDKIELRAEAGILELPDHRTQLFFQEQIQL
jgi:hypothetical protein